MNLLKRLVRVLITSIYLVGCAATLVVATAYFTTVHLAEKAMRAQAKQFTAHVQEALIPGVKDGKFWINVFTSEIARNNPSVYRVMVQDREGKIITSNVSKDYNTVIIDDGYKSAFTGKADTKAMGVFVSDPQIYAIGKNTEIVQTFYCSPSWYVARILYTTDTTLKSVCKNLLNKRPV